jgi:hypothetical protein
MLTSVGETQPVLSAGFSGLLSLKQAGRKNSSKGKSRSGKSKFLKEAIPAKIKQYLLAEGKFNAERLCNEGSE